jgi:hypothetical protein
MTSLGDPPKRNIRPFLEQFGQAPAATNVANSPAATSEFIRNLTRRKEARNGQSPPKRNIRPFLEQFKKTPPATNVVNSGKSNKARTNFPPTTRLPEPVETNMANSINSKKANTNTQLTTRASPVPNEEESLTAFFEKKNIPPNTNFLVMNPQKKNLGLTGLFANNQKKNSRKNRKNKSRKNRKNRKGNTRRS